MSVTQEPEYEIYALKYGARADRTRGDSYLLDANPNAPDAIEYFIWVIRNADRMYVVDTGFDAESAKRLNRKPFDDPATVLKQFGISAPDVDTVLITHMHFDHVGSLPPFSKAKFHLQEADLAYATGPGMKYDFLRRPYERGTVTQMVDHLHTGRAVLHNGDWQLAPGITLHRVDGHARGQQAIRINTRRGHVVLASDAAAFVEHFLDYKLSPIVVDAEAMLKAYDRLYELADSEDHIITGHDPLTSVVYPRVPAINAEVFKVHEKPSQNIRAALKAARSGEKR
jgi:glyoxylase-like metal-dependent hydrolase (beta-lactamase superfamily II)